MKPQRSASGQSLLEFALIFPLLFFLITGLFDLGRAVFDFASLNTLVREGTRYAIVYERCKLCADPEGSAKTAIETKMRYFFGDSNLFDDCVMGGSVCNVSIEYLDYGSTDPDIDPKIKIAIAFQFEPITPGLKQVLGNGVGIPINVESVMRLAPVAK